MDGNLLLTWFVTFLYMTTTRDVSGLNLTILHTNDVHGRIQEMNKYNSRCTSSNEGTCYGGQERLKSKIDELRAKFPNSLLLDGGDQYQGTTFFYVYGGEIMSHFMNVLGYDAMALGNHEFDQGPSGLKPFLDNVTFPVLSCNIDVSKTPELDSVNKSVVLKVAGQKIGIVGYTTSDTPKLSSPGNVKFEDEVNAIQDEVNKLIKMGVNKIIGLGHSGYDRDMEIAKKVRGLDVIVGGHSNTFLYSGEVPANEEPLGLYPTVVKNTNGQVLVVQDFAYGKYLGFLQVDFDDDGVVKGWNGNPILLDKSVPKDPEVTGLIKKYLPRVEKMLTAKVGNSSVYLEGDRAVCRVKECNMGNLITDAIIRYNTRYSQSTNGWNHVGIALYGGGGIRTSISEGDIMMTDVLGVMPFQNTIDLIELSGRALWEVMEHSASGWRDKGDLFGGFMQVSGLRVLYDMGQKVGRRVLRVQVLCTDCAIPEFKPLNLSKTYKVMTSSFLIKGGDGYTMFADNMGKSHVIGDLDSQVLLYYIKQASPIVEGLDGRIQFIQDVMGYQYCPAATASLGKPSILLMMTSLIAMTKLCF